MRRKIIYDVPRSAGVENMLARSRHMTEFKWTPAQEICVKQDAGGYPYLAPSKNGKPPVSLADQLAPYRDGRGPAGPMELTGIPYSSVRIANKFVGIDISFDTFLTATQNPASILYRQDNSDFDDEYYHCAIDNTYLYYGTVCSAFADYVYDLPMHLCTYEFGMSPDFYEVTDGTVNCLQLGDCLLVNRADGTVGGHIRVVTGIGRDEQGYVRMVEVSEGVTHAARARWYAAEEFTRTLLTGGGSDRVFRYRYLDSVSPVEPMVSHSGGQLMLNYGDYSNYAEGEMVEININIEADVLIIQGTDTKLEIPFDQIGYKTIQGNTYRMYCTDSLKPDSYVAYCMVGDKKKMPVHFIVYSLPQVKLTTLDGREYEKIALKPVDPDGKPLTKESECFYNEDGSLKPYAAVIALTDGQRLIKARVGVRERNGELVLRPAATLTDEAGKPVVFFKVGEDVTLYAYRVKRDTMMRVTFSGGERCEPDYISWTEERVVCHHQAMLTANDLHLGYTDCMVKQFMDNEFANFLLYCANEFGKVATKPVTFILD